VARIVRRRPEWVTKRVVRVEDGLRGRETGELTGSLLPREARGGEARADGEIRLAAAAALRRDHDDAARRLRAVDRRRGGAFQYLDVLDVVGVEIGDAIHRVLLAGDGNAAPGRLGDAVRAGRDRDVARDHAVDDVERCRVAEDGRRAAQSNAIAATGRAGVLLNLRARHFP